MTSWTRPIPSPTDTARLNELASTLTAGRDTYYRIAAEHKWVPAPGSPAEADAKALNGLTPNAIAENRLAEFALISEAIATFLELGVHNCGALAALFLAGEIYGPPYGALRSVIEDCAYALWMIGEPKDSAPDRLARAYVHNLFSAENAKTVQGQLALKTTTEFMVRTEAFRSIRKDAMEAFPATPESDIHNKIVDGQRYPKPLEEFTKRLFKMMEDHVGGTMTEREAEGLYNYLSNGTHPTLYVLRDMRTYYEKDGFARTNLGVDIPFLEKFTRLAAVTMLFTLKSVCSYYGWPTSEIDDFAKAITHVFPDPLKS